MLTKNGLSSHAGILPILSLAVIFLFINLGDVKLWQDEAETAMLARSVLKGGIPKAWDGKNLISSLNGADFNEDFIWTWHPWAQAYLTALSFSLLGESNFSARFPFALAGFLAIFFLYLLSLKLTNDNKIALLSSFFLTISLQFILYSRQCRYYSLLALSVILIIYSFYKLQSKTGRILFILSSTLLFHSNFLPFFPTIFGLFVFLIITNNQRKNIKHFLFCSAIIFLLTIPWLIYTKGFSQGVSLLGKGGEPSFIAQEFDLLKIVNENVFPLIFIPVAIYFLFKKRTAHREIYQLLLIIIILNLLFLPYISYTQNIIGMRYAVGLIPLFSFLSALIVKTLVDYKRWLGYFVFLILISTNILNSFPNIIFNAVSIPLKENTKTENLKSEFKNMLLGKKIYFDFLYELTHSYKGPVDGIVGFLNKYGKREDTVLTNYESAPILFYTNLNIAYVISNKPEFYSSIPSNEYNPIIEKKLPDYVYTLKKVDWIIPRANYRNRLFNRDKILKEMEKEGHRIKRYEIDSPDLPWNNRADIRYHKFRNVENYQKVVIYKVN